MVTSKSAGSKAAKPAAKAPRKTSTRKSPAKAAAKAKTAPKTAKTAASAAGKSTKPVSARKTAPKPAVPEAVSPEPVVVSESAPVAGGVPLNKRELVNAVALRSGVKRRDAKASVEAALEILGEAIADGRGVKLPGLGKVKIVKTKKLARATVYVSRIRQPIASGTTAPDTDPDGSDKDPLAEAAE